MRVWQREKDIDFSFIRFHTLIKFLYLIIWRIISQWRQKKDAYEIDINAVIHYNFNWQSNLDRFTIELILINLNVKFSFLPLLYFLKGISKI